MATTHNDHETRVQPRVHPAAPDLSQWHVVCTCGHRGEWLDTRRAAQAGADWHKAGLS